MQHSYPLANRVAHTTRTALAGYGRRLLALALLLPGVAWAQAPTITAVSPAPNTRAALRTAPVQVTFSQPLTAGSAGALKVFSSQRGGLRTVAAPATVSGNTLTFAPTNYGFVAGETVFHTITSAAASSTGSLAAPRVSQFTVASGNGPANLKVGSNPAVGVDAYRIRMADVDNDGDLDVLTTINSTTTTSGAGTSVSLLIRNGAGTFAPAVSITVGRAPQGIAMGDVDNDGDPDLVTANHGATTASVCLNNGSGTFGAATAVTVGTAPTGVALADIDADGDLDMLATIGAAAGTVAIRFNNGAGVFSGTTTATVGANPTALALGDVDNDGDLDLLTSNGGASTVSVCLNAGAGTFGPAVAVAVGTGPQTIVLGDVDGDGDLDLATSNLSVTTLSVRINNGTGTFGGGSTVTVTYNPYDLALADMDGDGDLDLTTTGSITNTTTGVTTTWVTVALNTGTGTFGTPASITAGNQSYGLATGDIDGDGDLDLALANYNSTVTVVLNANVAAPTITSFAPNPAVAGQAVTITGTNLFGVTSLLVNGVAANPASFINNTGTRLTFRVPATAPASGTTTLVNDGGTVSRTTLAVGTATPPGNALAFDGTNDLVTFGPTPAVNNLGPGSFTLEAWVYYTGGTGANSIIRKTGDYNLYLNNGKLSAEVWPLGATNANWRVLNGSVSVPANRWTHVAATWSTAANSFQLYLNGVADAGATGSTGTVAGSENLTLGNSTIYTTDRLNGRLDEVRIYTAALTAAQVQADMRSTTAAVPASLGLYLNFDQGTASGANTGQTTLYDQTANAYAGGLTNFVLTSGNTTSNWVESYALVVPTATAATALTSASFTANWTAPAVGTVDNGYLLDVSTADDFSSPVAGSPFAVSSGTSQAVTGLTALTTYYYRVRADKTSVTGQGAYSNTITATTCAPPVALAQNVSLTLSAGGTASTTATAVNNGSTADCGPAPAGVLSITPSSFGCADVVPATVASALTLNGTNQYVAIPATAAVPVGNSQYTIEAWIKPNAMGVYGIIGWGTYGVNNQVNALRLSDTGIINYWWGPDLIVSTADLSGAWHHVAATFDGTTRTIYLDGVAMGSDTPGAHTVPNANNLRIGSTNNGEYFPGSIDEVRVWNVGRTAAQIKATKNVGLPGGTAGLVAYYRLNEGSGTLAADATGNTANLGTLTGSPTWTTDAAPVVNGVPVTLTVTDVGGNTSTAPAVVTVTDNTAPTAVAQNVAVALTVGGTATVTAAQVNNNSTDNCTATIVGLLSPTEGVANGTFDTGTTSWALTNGASYSSTGGNPGGYIWLNDTGTAGTDPTATQTLSGLSVGTTYQLSGSYRNVANCCGAGAGAIAFGIDLSGMQVAALPDPGTGWTPFKLYFTATATSQVLAFRGEINGTDVDIAIDNISVRPFVSALTFACAQVGANPVTLLVADAAGNRSTATATATVSVPGTPTTTWNGSTSTDWTDCANWSYGKVPDAATNAVIPTGQPRYPNLSTGTVAINSLTINNGFTVGSAAILQVNGSFTMNGTTTLGGTVALVGTAAQQVGGTSTASSFPNLTVNKTSGTVTLLRTLPLSGTLVFAPGAANVGVLNTGAYRISLSSTASVSETETSYVLGKIAASQPLAAGTAQSFNGLGLTLTPAAGSTAPGATQVTRTTGTALAGAGTSQSILRNFDIVPTVNTGLNVTMNFGYFTHELNGIPVANLRLFKSVSGGTPWTPQRGTTASTNVVTKTGITDFSVWTLGNAANPLPVELTAFTATAEGPAAVRLAWTTASEKNSDRFDVERSLNGTTFERIGTVAGQGTRASATTYALLDTQLPSHAATLYYRLKQVDLDSTASYSAVRVVSFTQSRSHAITVYPNPAHGGAATLTGALPGTVVAVYDALGRLVTSAPADATGTAALALPAGLPVGVYVVRAGSKALRLTVD